MSIWQIIVMVETALLVALLGCTWIIGKLIKMDEKECDARKGARQ